MLPPTLLVFAISVSVIVSANPFPEFIGRGLFVDSDEVRIQRCGESLEFMEMICRSSDIEVVVRKSDSGELVWLEEEGWVFIEKENIDSNKPNANKKGEELAAVAHMRRRGIIQDCCKKSCTLKQIMSYCD